MVNCDQLIEHYGEKRLEPLAFVEAMASGEQSKRLNDSGFRGMAMSEVMSHTGAFSCYCNSLIE